MCGKMLVSFRLDSSVPEEKSKIKSPNPCQIWCLGEIQCRARIIVWGFFWFGFVYGKFNIEMDTLFWEVKDKDYRVCTR